MVSIIAQVRSVVKVSAFRSFSVAVVAPLLRFKQL